MRVNDNFVNNFDYIKVNKNDIYFCNISTAACW